MAVKPVDRRVQRTYKILHEALVELIVEKGYEQVSVQDIIDRANIGKSTFYSHFQDKEDLFLRGFENLWFMFEEQFAEHTHETMEVWEISLIVFQHAQHYVNVYKALVGEAGGKLMSATMHKYLSLLMHNSLKLKWAGGKTVPLDLVGQHLASSLINSLTWWVDHDLTYSAEQMNSMYRQLTQPAIESILQTGQ